MQNMDKLRNRVTLFHDDFPCPVGQHLMAILHSRRHCWGEDCHCLPHNGTSLHCMGLQEAMEDLGREGASHLTGAWSKQHWHPLAAKTKLQSVLHSTLCQKLTGRPLGQPLLLNHSLRHLGYRNNTHFKYTHSAFHTLFF